VFYLWTLTVCVKPIHFVFLHMSYFQKKEEAGKKKKGRNCHNMKLRPGEGREGEEPFVLPRGAISTTDEQRPLHIFLYQ